MDDPDFLLALKLQQEYSEELNNLQSNAINVVNAPSKPTAKKQAPKRRSSDDIDLNCTQNLVHPQWETLDPTPDVHAMFLAFDNKFFQARLKCVLLEWSKRMYSCAGICYFRRNSLGMSIIIRLSEPLLKLRPRKDLIETLLHEMIHAYCFVLGIREGNGGHGPNFQKIMHGINKVAGTNITVYHTFHDEVDLYKVHWWRCNGICQHRKPFFGYVKRTSNRAPGPNDFWWRSHIESCGGNFLKIKGPEQSSKKGKTNNAIDNQIVEIKTTPVKDIRNYFVPKNQSSTNSSNPAHTLNSYNNFIKGPVKSNGGGTFLLNPKAKTSTVTENKNNTNSSSKVPLSGGNLKNVVGLKDIGDGSPGAIKPKRSDNTFPVSAQGYSLNSTSTNILENNFCTGSVDRSRLREIWSQRFSQPNLKEAIDITKIEGDQVVDLVSVTSVQVLPKKRKRDSEEWEVLSDDVCIKNVQPEIIDLSDDNEKDDGPIQLQDVYTTSQPKIRLSQAERQVKIKKEILENSDLSEDDIELIDDDYDDTLTNLVDLTDTTLIDDFFADDVLLKEFNTENSVVPSGSRHFPDPNKDIVTCPICQSKVTREHLEVHLDGCIGISTKIEPKSYGSRVMQGSRIIHPTSKIKPKISQRQKEVLKKAGYSDTDIASIKVTPINTTDDVSSSDDDNLSEGQLRRKGLTQSTHTCPVCGNEVEVKKINKHLRICNKSSPPMSTERTPVMNSTPKSTEKNLFQICPVCNKNIRSNVMNEHLDLCLQEFNDDF